MAEKRQDVALKESISFCLLAGVFVYFAASTPLILFRLFPPKPSVEVDILHTAFYPPKIGIFVIGFGISILLGVYLVRKARFKNRLTHFSILALTLAIGGGFLTGMLEVGFYLFLVVDDSARDFFFATLSDHFYGFQQSIEWIILFSVAMMSFTGLYFFINFLIRKFSLRVSFR